MTTDPATDTGTAAHPGLLFDLLQSSPPNTGLLALCAAGLGLALLAWWRRGRRGQATGTPRFFAAALALVVAGCCVSLWDHHRLGVALRLGQVQVVEGLLQSHAVQHRARYNPSSKRYDRSVAESFYVGDVAFGFVRDGSVPGFTNSGDSPLALANGETLRVHYVEDTPGDFASRRILRLERLAGPAPATLAATGSWLLPVRP